MKCIFKFLKELFKKKLFVKENPSEFYNFFINKYNNMVISGYRFYTLITPEIGDLLIVDMKSGNQAIYVFTEIKYTDDPKDMFFYKAQFLKYKGEMKWKKRNGNV